MSKIISIIIAIICFLSSLWIMFWIFIYKAENLALLWPDTRITQLEILAAILFSSSGIMFAIHSITSKKDEEELKRWEKENDYTISDEERLAEQKKHRAQLLADITNDEEKND